MSGSPFRDLPLDAQLDLELGAFAACHGLEYDDVRKQMIGWALTKKDLFHKSGLAVGSSTNVLAGLKNDSNVISLLGSSWSGDLPARRELVVLTESRVLGSVPLDGVTRADVGFVLFDTDRVWTFHWGDLTGTYADRH